MPSAHHAPLPISLVGLTRAEPPDCTALGSRLGDLSDRCRAYPQNVHYRLDAGPRCVWCPRPCASCAVSQRGPGNAAVLVTRSRTPDAAAARHGTSPAAIRDDVHASPARTPHSANGPYAVAPAAAG